MQRFLDEAARLISLRSVTADGNEELANHVASLMRTAGLKVQLQQVMHSIEGISKRQFNVIGILGDPLVDKKTRKGLLLTTHLDTAAPGRADAWTVSEGNPFKMTVRDGRAVGLGAAEAKIDFLCKLRAVAGFRERKLKMPIYLAGTCGEELGMFGARYLIKSMALNPLHVAVGAPTGLAMVTSQKAYAVFRVSVGYHRLARDARGFNRQVHLEAVGRSAHSSTPDSGVNAAIALLAFIKGAQESGFELRLSSLSGGEAVNRVPDQARALLHLTSHQLEDFKAYFQENAGADAPGAAEFRAEMGGLGDSGIQFYPDALFPAVCDVVAVFGSIAELLQAQCDEASVPPQSTVNFGQVIDRAGAIDLRFDLRLAASISLEEIERELRGMIQKLAAHYPGLNMAVTRERTHAGLAPQQDSAFATICREAARAAEIPDSSALAVKAAATEAVCYRQAGYDTVVFGPGEISGASHSPNEGVRTDDIEGAIRFYERLIERTCL